ncbi:MAG: cytochrome c [Terracidiphilus sp.]|jgi:mono/diheme cytochrome c family protein
MMRRSLAVLLILLSAAAAVAAVSSSRWEQVPVKDHARANPLAGQPEAVAAGALVYREHCQQCHKANALGDGHRRPALRSDRIRSASDGDIEWFLRQGDLGHGMPSWSSLPQAQRWQVVAYLRSIQ